MIKVAADSRCIVVDVASAGRSGAADERAIPTNPIIDGGVRNSANDTYAMSMLRPSQAVAHLAVNASGYKTFVEMKEAIKEYVMAMTQWISAVWRRLDKEMFRWK